MTICFIEFTSEWVDNIVQKGAPVLWATSIFSLSYNVFICHVPLGLFHHEMGMDNSLPSSKISDCCRLTALADGITKKAQIKESFIR